MFEDGLAAKQDGTFILGRHMGRLIQTGSSKPDLETSPDNTKCKKHFARFDMKDEDEDPSCVRS